MAQLGRRLSTGVATERTVFQTRGNRSNSANCDHVATRRSSQPPNDLVCLERERLGQDGVTTLSLFVPVLRERRRSVLRVDATIRGRLFGTSVQHRELRGAHTHDCARMRFGVRQAGDSLGRHACVFQPRRSMHDTTSKQDSQLPNPSHHQIHHQHRRARIQRLCGGKLRVQSVHTRTHGGVIFLSKFR